MTKILKEPLLHFLGAGLFLFVFFEFVSPDDVMLDESVILVDRDSLLLFLQYRTNTFQPDLAASRLDSMSDESFERLVRDYVREEALYRQALQLDMEENDYIIKRRLIQKVEFLSESFAEAVAAPDEDVIEAYYKENRETYYIEPLVTFTHVFYGNDERGQETAVQLASAKVTELNSQGVSFSDAIKHGERFLYFTNYVERTPEFVVSHFGAGMAATIFDLPADDTTWHGPQVSAYGAHVVMVSRQQPGRFPDLSEVRGRVENDARRTRVREQTDTAIKAIVETYDVRVDVNRVSEGIDLVESSP